MQVTVTVAELYSLMSLARAAQRAADNEQWPTMYQYEGRIDDMINNIKTRTQEIV